MKKTLLLSGMSMFGLAAFAAGVQEPLEYNDAFIQKLSPNGKYAVSCLLSSSLEIINFESGEKFKYVSSDEYNPEDYYFGIGQSISDNGIVVGGRTSSNAEYWKNGEWHELDVDGRTSFSNSATAISRNGLRICGMLASGEFSFDDDVLMIVPCIWNAEGDGYGEPEILPYPKFDFTGRVPQYIKAIDMSGDGKTVIGMVTDASGKFTYPILYKENEDGVWSYEIPHEDLLMPEGFELPEDPGYFNDPYPSYEDYMTQEESQAYIDAVNDYYMIGDFSVPYPTVEEFMTPESAEEYSKAMAEYNAKQAVWQEKYDAYQQACDILTEYGPSYQDNSVRISCDGLSYGCTIAKGGGFWSGTPATYHVWVFDMNSENITKYDKQDNLCLTYLADGGVAVASTPVSNINPSNSFILKDGDVTGMYDWMNSKVPSYASWMKENMVFEYEGFDEEWNKVLMEEFMTGHAVSTPDLSVMALSVNNIGFPVDDEVWEDPDYSPIIGYGYVFNLNEGSAVEAVSPAAYGNAIYDLSGRRLKGVCAPGIYIVDGEKKVVR